MRILVHSGQAHVDDFLAVAVLLAKFPEAVVHRVPKVPTIQPNDIVVDIGGKYDGVQYFDHHHDPNLPASVVLVIKKFYPEIQTENIDEIQWISDWDVMGPMKAQQKWNVKFPDFRDPIAEIVLQMFGEREIIQPGETLHDFMIQFGKKFIEYLEEQTKFLEKARNARVYEVKGLKIVEMNEIIPIRFIKKVHPHVAIVVQPNPRTKGAVSVTRIDDHPRVDFRRIKGKVPAHFIHANGFMAVIDPQYISTMLDLAIQ